MRYQVIHKTQYVYEEPASLSYSEARIWPRTFDLPLFSQFCLSHQIETEPYWRDSRERTDFFGNPVIYFTLRQPHQQATITATSAVQIEPAFSGTGSIVDHLQQKAEANSPWEAVRQRLHGDLAPEVLDARQFAMNSPLVTASPPLADFAAPSFPAERPILEAVLDLMARIYREFDFVPGATTIATPLLEVLAKRRGVCQDFAQLMLGCLRAQGLAARYVSGYIETIPPPGQKKLAGADASHAWCAVFVPDLGWIDVDPTNNLLPHDQHITVAWGRDYSDVPPLRGVLFGSGAHELDVSVDVTRLEG